MHQRRVHVAATVTSALPTGRKTYFVENGPCRGDSVPCETMERSLFAPECCDHSWSRSEQQSTTGTDNRQLKNIFSARPRVPTAEQCANSPAMRALENRKFSRYARAHPAWWAMYGSQQGGGASTPRSQQRSGANTPRTSQQGRQQYTPRSPQHPRATSRPGSARVPPQQQPHSARPARPKSALSHRGQQPRPQSARRSGQATPRPEWGPPMTLRQRSYRDGEGESRTESVSVHFQEDSCRVRTPSARRRGCSGQDRRQGSKTSSAAETESTAAPGFSCSPRASIYWDFSTSPNSVDEEMASCISSPNSMMHPGLA